MIKKILRLRLMSSEMGDYMLKTYAMMVLSAVVTITMIVCSRYISHKIIRLWPGVLLFSLFYAFLFLLYYLWVLIRLIFERDYKKECIAGLAAITFFVLFVSIFMVIPLSREQVQWHWAKLRKSSESYNSYILRWPKGYYIDEAKQSYEKYYLEESSKKYWDRTISENSLEAFLTYQKNLPDGPYIHFVDKAIEIITESQTKPKIHKAKKVRLEISKSCGFHQSIHTVVKSYLDRVGTIICTDDSDDYEAVLNISFLGNPLSETYGILGKSAWRTPFAIPIQGASSGAEIKGNIQYIFQDKILLEKSCFGHYPPPKSISSKKLSSPVPYYLAHKKKGSLLNEISAILGKICGPALWVQNLKHDSPVVRESAVDAMISEMGPAALQPLIDATYNKKETYDYRKYYMALIDVIGSIGDPKGVEAILNIASKNYSLKYHAQDTILMMGGDEIKKQLIKLLEGKYKNKRKTVEYLLNKMGN